MSERKSRESAWSQGKIKRPPQKRRRKEALEPAERRRLAQLLVCVALFVVIFAGQGLPLGRLSAFGDRVAAIIHHNTDFKGAFTQMGQDVSEGEPFVETFGKLWTEVFALESDEEAQEEAASEESAGSPAGEGESDTLLQPMHEESPLAPPENAAAETPPPEPAPEDILPPEPVEVEATPETVTPVMGVLTSPFGYRSHPIDGEWKEHQGVDINAEAGVPILAYAAGVVDYVGESEAYGLYLQLKHEGNVTTFYAHCSEINVKKGQPVAAGERIAAVGDTGNTTGPHLHLEMKRDGVRVNPLDYIETLTP